jgi:hypothetical protein
MADQLGRFSIAMAVIALFATGLYQFSGFASYKAPGTPGIVFHSR